MISGIVILAAFGLRLLVRDCKWKLRQVLNDEYMISISAVKKRDFEAQQWSLDYSSVESNLY